MEDIMKAFVATLTLTLLLSSTSFARDCVWKRDIRDWFPVDNNTIELWTASGTYDVHTKNCSSLRFADRIGFRTFPRNSWEVCEDDNILVYDASGRNILQRCRILDID